jgi:hypothetical protein
MQCQYCSRALADQAAAKAKHEKSCRENPNRVAAPNQWNKGYVWREESLKKMSIAAGKRRHSEETKVKLSKIAKEREFGGKTSRNAIWYNGMYLHSSYELSLAKSLETHGVKFDRGMHFKYTGVDGKEHRYYPDFYLPEYDVYLDPKNDYLIWKDSEKIKRVQEQNNITVLVLDRESLDWDSLKIRLVSTIGSATVL